MFYIYPGLFVWFALKSFFCEFLNVEPILVKIGVTPQKINFSKKKNPVDVDKIWSFDVKLI